MFWVSEVPVTVIKVYRTRVKFSSVELSFCEPEASLTPVKPRVWEMLEETRIDVQTITFHALKLTHRLEDTKTRTVLVLWSVVRDRSVCGCVCERATMHGG